ncbi:hypothetical protein [Streptomyces sp. NPDC023327]|uniref:hypothetical protein n=1 Tax=Streptomyces sp. NPDC023327 TaxID=3157088 RepID=UPI0033F7E910
MTAELQAALDGLRHALRTGPPERGRAALRQVTAVAGPLLARPTLAAVEHGLRTGSWTAAGDDALRTALVRPSAAWIVVLPPGATGAAPAVLWSEPWQAGQRIVKRAVIAGAESTQTLFGYRTASTPPTVLARRIRFGPEALADADALGRLPLGPRPPARVAHPVWLLLAPGPTDGSQPHGTSEAHTRTAWAVHACMLGAEGPLSPRRIRLRGASDSQLWQASALVGVLAGWLALSRTGQTAPVGPVPVPVSRKADTAIGAHPGHQAVRDVLEMWHGADPTTRARELLRACLPLLMADEPTAFERFGRWFDKERDGRS